MSKSASPASTKPSATRAAKTLSKRAQAKRERVSSAARSLAAVGHKKRKRRSKAEIEAANRVTADNGVAKHIEACQQRGETHRSLIDELKDVQKDVLSRPHNLESRIEQA